VPSADRQIAWRLFLRASNDDGLRRLVARLAVAASIDLEVIAAERYGRSLQRAQPIAGP
jgi:hypothetical protein